MSLTRNMAAYREEEDPFEEDIVFDQAGLLNNTSKINTAIRRVSSGKCVLFAKTLGLCGAFFGLGLCIAIPGPTFLSPLTALEVNVSNIYVARSSGYLIGAIIGGMLFDHFNRLFLLFLSLLLTSIFITVAPWCQVLWLQVTCMVTLGITMGFLDTGGNVLCLDLWGRNSGPFMQALHFSFGLGAFVAPLLAVPFLEPTALNVFVTDVSQFVTEYPVQISIEEGAGAFSMQTRVERDVEGSNDTGIFNKSQVAAENLFSNNSLSVPKFNTSTEPSLNNISYYTELDIGMSDMPESEINEPASPGSTVSVPNTTVKQKALKHKPSITDGSKLGNTNWDVVHVGKPPLADLMPATTTGTTKLTTVSGSTTLSSVSSPSPALSSGITENSSITILIASAQSPIFIPTSPTTGSVTVTETSLTSITSDLRINKKKNSVTTDKLVGSRLDNINQGNVPFPDTIDNSFGNLTNMFLGSKQKSVWSIYSSTQPSPREYEHSFSSTMDPVQTNQTSKVDHASTISNEGHITESTYTDSAYIPESKLDSLQLEPPQQPLLSLSLKENASSTGPLYSSVLDVQKNTSNFGSVNDFQEFQLSTQDKHVTKGSSLGHEEFYVQNSRGGETLDRTDENTFSDSRILSNDDDDDFPKEHNESKVVNDDGYVDIPPVTTLENSNSQSISNSGHFLKDNGSKIIDFETISDRELHLPSLSATASTIMNELDEITSSLNYINSPAASKHIHKKPGTFDNDTEHINTIFDVFANRIEKYGFNKLQFSYLIVGIFVFSVSVIFLGFLCHNPRDPKSKQEEGQGSKKIVNKTVHKMLVSLMAFFFFLYMGMEVTYGQLVLAFAMHSNLKLSQSTGSVISVVFWGSFAAMRFASIFFASGFSPLTMLILNFAFCTTGTLLVSALANHVETALWVGTALIGIGLASMFPTGILWIERYIHVSNKVAAVFVIGVSLGQMICPITVYRLMVNNPQMLMQSALVINILCILAFVALWWLASRQGEKYSVVINNGYQLANQNDEEEDMLDMSPSGSAVTFRRPSFSSEHRALLNGNVHRGP